MTALAITEADWQGQVVELAGLLGWYHLHVRRTVGRGRKWTTSTNLAGWPDLLLWHTGKRRVVAVELKSESGVVSDEQAAVLASLEAAGVEAHVFRPSQLEELKAVLS